MPVYKRSPVFIAGLLSVLLPFSLYLLTMGDSLGFADAGEFALVTRILGIAHAPGFPAYVVTGWLWGLVAGVFSDSHIISMAVFSAVCVASASGLLFRTCLLMLESRGAMACAASALSAIAFCTGYTVWHWANSVEVYGFHIMAMSLLLYGLFSWQAERKQMGLFIAAAGLACGLANHHLTMIFFIPFTLVFFATRQPGSGGISGSFPLKRILKEKALWVFAGTAFVLMAGFYGWMYVRAGHHIDFKFGNPDNPSRLFYHLAGGSWQKNTARSVEGLVALRMPYFLGLTWQHLLLYIPFFVSGLFYFFRSGRKALAATVLLYFLVVFAYQLRIDQTADTDAYMLLPFFLMTLPVAAGLYRSIEKYRWIRWLAPALLVMQVAWYFPRQQKHDFNVSASLMGQLDRSVPEGAVLMVSDWTTVSQYYYFRLGESFREDIILLNYDLKFTNWQILPAVYPEFYQVIREEYDEFIRLLGLAHPQEIYNTGCTLDTPELMNAYLAVVRRIKSWCAEQRVAFMCDPKAYLFLMQYGVMGTEAHMSGFFISSTRTDLGRDFVSLPFAWLDSPLLLDEPAASDKVVDFEAALDFSRNYYSQLGDTAMARQADESYRRIKSLQRRMKKHMPFVYRPKGQ